MSSESSLAANLLQCLTNLKHLAFSTDSKLYIQEFRNVITSCQKLTSTPNSLLPPCLGPLADALLSILASSPRLSLEARSLGGVALALVLCTISEPSSVALMYSKSFLSPLSASGEVLCVRLYKGGPELALNVASEEIPTFRLCLAHGLLQIQPQSFWLSTQVSQSSWNSLLVDRLFSLLEKEAFSYSHRTLLAFKCLVVWAKRFHHGNLNGRLSCQLATSLFNIIASNWENPFNGVREQNSLLLEQLMYMTKMQDNLDIPSLLRPSNLVDLILTEMSWKVKSKFFYLSIIVPSVSPLMVINNYYDDIIEGLELSLQFSHLVPAGAELYRMILEYLPLEQWTNLFLPRILAILIDSNNVTSKLNLFNYWMLPTLKKYRESLLLIYDGLIEEASTKPNERLLHSIVLCLKLGRKEGYEEMAWVSIRTSPHLPLALTHLDDHIRSTAFAVVCTSSKVSSLINSDEFAYVEHFLQENINSDSTTLRQSLVNSFTTFIVRLRDSCLQVLKNQEKLGCANLIRSMDFLDWLLTFLTSCLEIGSNYQRKIAALELYRVVLNYLVDKNGGERKNNVKADGLRVMKHCIAVGKWGFTSETSRESLLFCISDSAEDVRESASYLLSNYFKLSDQDFPRFNVLFNKGISLCGDPMFYNSEAGALLVYTITCLSHKGSFGASKFVELQADRVSAGLLPIAEKQFTALKDDILVAATNGSPLYGVLRAIGQLALDPASPEYYQLTAVENNRLLDLIEAVVRHLLAILSSKSTSITEYAPSFLEMGEAIKIIVTESSLNVEESDKYHLSPAYQLVLNTIWLNLKICCWVASKLPSVGGDANRCLSLILSILRQTKHKGALEAAGVSLGVLVKFLALTPDSCLLEEALAQSLSRLASGTTESTRGAGSVILLHRLVANDIRPGKPLVGKCLAKLVDLVEKRTGHTSQALHLLAVLLKDKSLAQETAKVIHRLATASFACLSHSSWAVRNTSLQLFGAIVPRLVGQRKPSENDSSCSCYHLPYEELYYHGQTLVNNMLNQLSSISSSSPIDHAPIVPVMSLLSSLCIGLLTIIDRDLSQNVFDKFFSAFRSLMSSPISKVRQLAAQASAWFCSPSQISRVIQMHVWKIVAFIRDRNEENEIKTENELHGFLLNAKYLIERFEAEKKGVSALRKNEREVESALNELKRVSSRSMNLSFVCKTVIVDIVGFEEHLSCAAHYEQLSASLTEPHKSLGLHIWKDAATKDIILKSSFDRLLFCVKAGFDSQDPEVINSTLCSLEQRIPCQQFEAVSNPIVSYFLKLIGDGNSSSDLRKIIFEILYRHKPHNLNGNVNGVIGLLLSEGTPLSVAICCGLLALDQGHKKKLVEDVVAALTRFAQPSEYEDNRLVAARGLSLMNIFILRPSNDDDKTSNSAKSVRCQLWEMTVALLQDENPIIRNEASKFAVSIIGASHPLNPNLCLKKLMEPSVLLKHFYLKDVVNCLLSPLNCPQDELEGVLDSCENARIVDDGDNYLNPFSNSVDNEYAEPVKLIEISVEGLLGLMRSEPSVSMYIEEVLSPDMKSLEKQGLQLVELSAALFHRLLVDSKWYLIGKQLSSQFLLVNKARASKSR